MMRHLFDFDPALNATNSADFPAILRWTSFLSLVGSAATGSVYLFYVRPRPHLNSITSRLVAHTSFYDLILSISLMWIAYLATGGGLCEFLMFIQAWGVVGGQMVPMVLAFHVQLAITRKSLPALWEKYFHIGCFCLSLLIALLPIFADAYGWDYQFGYCWYKHSATTGLGWTLGTYYIWILVGLAYNSFVFTWAAYTTWTLYRKSLGASKKNRQQYALMIRFLLYPIIIIVVQFGNAGAQIQAWKDGEFHLILSIMNQAFGTLQGFFYALVWFGFDQAFKDWRRIIFRGFCDQVEMDTDASGTDQVDASSNTIAVTTVEKKANPPAESIEV